MSYADFHPRRPISDEEWGSTRRTITRAVQAERLRAGRAAALARMPKGCADRVFVLGCTTAIDQTAELATLPAAWGERPESAPTRGARWLRACRGAMTAVGCLGFAAVCAAASIAAGALLGLGA